MTNDGLLLENLFDYKLTWKYRFLKFLFLLAREMLAIFQNTLRVVVLILFVGQVSYLELKSSEQNYSVNVSGPDLFITGDQEPFSSI